VRQADCVTAVLMLASYAAVALLAGAAVLRHRDITA
jgi:hypothetical protein